jgi:hypothetical protein
MNPMKYYLSEEHQRNKEELRTRCEGLVKHAEFIKRYAEITDLSSILHFLPQLIAAAEVALAHTQQMKQRLREGQEANE